MLEAFGGSESERVVPEVNADGSSRWTGLLQPQPRSANQGWRDKLPERCEAPGRSRPKWTKEARGVTYDIVGDPS
jgi:hypothetical protein